MKRICFPATFRGHLARQKLLIEELKKEFEVDIFEPKTSKQGGMAVYAIMCAVEFNNFLAKNTYDCVLIRGDRFEMLPLAAVAVYKGITVVHIEGGDLSGAIDNKIRHAITQLSDYHFCTNELSHQRLIQSGVATDRVWDLGSLDVEYAESVPVKQLHTEPYIFVAFHPIPDEDTTEVTEALKDYHVIMAASNNDYGKRYGEEEYSPDDYINLMRGAEVLVGNSSSFLKEASILGVPVVLVGERQHRRLLPKNVLHVPCETDRIKHAIEFQKNAPRQKDYTYFQKETSKKITEVLQGVL